MAPSYDSNSKPQPRKRLSCALDLARESSRSHGACDESCNLICPGNQLWSRSLWSLKSGVTDTVAEETQLALPLQAVLPAKDQESPQSPRLRQSLQKGTLSALDSLHTHTRSTHCLELRATVSCFSSAAEVLEWSLIRRADRSAVNARNLAFKTRSSEPAR